jgi:UDP-N-acetylmuramoyl-tripeptide--D-alanyl-D-alanine ligase
LGDGAVDYHREIGSRLATFDFDLILTVGPLSEHTVASAISSGVAAARLLHFKDTQACAEACDGLLIAGDLVYLKGSRGIGLETVLKRFTNREGKA